jgi:hypothetical protein
MTKLSFFKVGCICFELLSQGIFLYWKHLSHNLLGISKSCYIPLSPFIFGCQITLRLKVFFFSGTRYNVVREMFVRFYTLEQIRDCRHEILLLCCQKPQDNEIRCHPTRTQVFN